MVTQWQILARRDCGCLQHGLVRWPMNALLYSAIEPVSDAPLQVVSHARAGAIVVPGARRQGC